MEAAQRLFTAGLQPRFWLISILQTLCLLVLFSSYPSVTSSLELEIQAPGCGVKAVKVSTHVKDGASP